MFSCWFSMLFVSVFILLVFLTFSDNTTIKNVLEIKENMTMGSTLVTNPNGGFLVRGCVHFFTAKPKKQTSRHHKFTSSPNRFHVPQLHVMSLESNGILSISCTDEKKIESN